jgi:non-homologous end joining protein Ku
VRSAEEVFDRIPKAEADASMVDIAARIIAQQEGPFDPSKFNDRYEDALRKADPREAERATRSRRSRRRRRPRSST